MTRQVITPRFVLRPQRCTTTRCDTAPTMTLRRDASPASPGRRPAIAGSSTPPSALLSRRKPFGTVGHEGEYADRKRIVAWRIDQQGNAGITQTEDIRHKPRGQESRP